MIRLSRLRKSLTASGRARWRRSSLAETDASDLISAACYRRPEHVVVAPVVVAELKFRDVERHIFGAHLVERADYAALEDRPKAFDRVRVNHADNVFVIGMPDGLVTVAKDKPFEAFDGN